MSAKAFIFSGNVATVAGVVVAAGVSIFALVASGVLDGRDPVAPVVQTETPPVAQSTEPTETAVAPDAGNEPAAADPEQPEPEIAEAATELPIAPSFDLVRVDAQGNTVIAGSAAAGGLLAILLDGLEISETQAGGDGKFAAILAIAPSSDARVLSLVERKDSGDVPSDATMIIAPVQVAVADVSTVADPVTDPNHAANAVAGTSEADGVSEDVSSPVIVVENQTDSSDTSSDLVGENSAETPEGVIAPQSATPDVKEAVAPTVEPVATVAEQDVLVSQPAPVSQPEVAAPVAASDVVEGGAETKDTTETARAAEAKPAAAQDVTTEGAQAPVAQTSSAAPAAPAQDTIQTVEATPDKTETAAQAEAPEVIEQTPKAPAILVSDAEGVRVVQPAAANQAAPDVLAAVAIDSISYSDNGAVVVSGRGGAQSFVRLYLNNSLAGDSKISGDGQWRLELLDVAAGVYTMRVDEVNDTGKVVSRVQTPFKREAPEIVAQAQSQAQTTTDPTPQSGAGDLSKPDVSQTEVTTENPSEAAVVPAVRVVTVQPGSTLWAIARERYGEGVMYVRVFEANKDKIRDPHLIYPGQVFAIPE